MFYVAHLIQIQFGKELALCNENCNLVYEKKTIIICTVLEVLERINKEKLLYPGPMWQAKIRKTRALMSHVHRFFGLATLQPMRVVTFQSFLSWCRFPSKRYRESLTIDTNICVGMRRQRERRHSCTRICGCVTHTWHTCFLNTG